MDKIDKIFKEALGNHSEPFDPSSWEAISKRLDAQMPSKQNPFLKWGIPGAAVVVCASMALWYFSSNSNETIVKGNNAKENSIPAPSQNDTESVKNPITQTTSKKSIQTTESEPLVTKTKTPVTLLANTTKETSTTLEANSQINPLQREAETKEEIQLEKRINSTPTELNAAQGYEPLALPKCVEEEVRLENKNDFDVYVVGSKFYLQIPSKSAKKIQIKETGAIEVYKMQGGKLTDKSLQTQWVKKPFNTDIQLDDVNYSSGLPIKGIHLKTDAIIQSVQLNNKAIGKTAKDLEINMFEAGQYHLKVSTSDETGCTNVVTENFYVSDAYNLLAVNAFDPYSSDIRKNTFLPYALTKRNTPFKMVILDPSDGGLVFETLDGNLPWDGTDRRNGKMVESNKAFIWKVTLEKPEIGEKSDYLGTVVRM